MSGSCFTATGRRAKMPMSSLTHAAVPRHSRAARSTGGFAGCRGAAGLSGVLQCNRSAAQIVLTHSGGSAGDLRTLSRPSSIPRPAFAWKTRVLVPGVILVALLLLLGYTMKDALVPARAVHVMPVVLKAGGDATSASSGPA